MKTLRTFAYPLLLLCAAVSPTLASAQTAVAPATPGDPKDPVIQLSTFVVSSERDYGYRATNSITATRVGTAIADTPINIQVLTGEFITDTGAIELREVVSRVSGVTTSQRDRDLFKVRGFDSPVLRDGFSRERYAPTAFVDRIEVVKGPNAIFFGRVVPGGVINMISKKPEWTQQENVKLTLGSYAYQRAELDVTGPLTKTFAYRLYGSVIDSNDWRDYNYNEETSVNAAFTWKLTPKLQWDVNVEHADGKRNETPFAPRSTPEYLASGVDPSIAVNTYTSANFPANTPFLTSYAPYELVYGDRGKKGNVDGPDAFMRLLAETATSTLTWAANDWLTFRSAANYVYYERESLALGSFPRIDGSYRTGATWSQYGKDILTLQNELVAAFTTGALKHKVLAGYEYRLEHAKTRSRTSPTVIYFPKKDPVHHYAADFANVSWNPNWTTSRDNQQACYVTDQVSMFNEKLHVLAGMRYTKVETLPGGSLTGPNLSGRRESSDTTPQIGAVFKITEGFNLFASYSRTFEPQGDLGIDGRISTPALGKGMEFGVKTDWMDSKISGTVSAYWIEKDNISQRDFVRELLEGRLPFYTQGAAQKMQGYEMDLTFTPTRHYQALFSYSYMPTAKFDKNPSNVAKEGLRTENTPEHAASFWNKYTFTSDALRGAYVGLGLRYSSSVQAHPDPISVRIVNPSYTTVDMLIGYDTKLFGRNARLTLNAKNLLDEEYYEGSFVLADPRKVYASLELKF